LRCDHNGRSNSNKRKVILTVEGAKTAETRQRRISTLLTLLIEGQVSP
jgi:hypothetical protein